VTDLQRADGRVMCWSCQTATPFADLAFDADGIPTDLCKSCASQPIDFCDSSWAPPRGTTDLPDIADYQEQQHG
jgi:hypothetical protein